MLEVRGSRAALIRAYDFFSYLYGSTAARLERAGVTHGLVRAGVRPAERVLEVAVGTGVVHTRLRQRLGASGLLVGVDLSWGMLRATRRLIPGAWVARADARALPFPDGFFDLVWASYFLDLIPTGEITAVLEEFRRVLRAPSLRSGQAGGRLVLVNLSKNGPGLTWWERLYRLAPDWLVPWLFCGSRPVEAEPFVRAAGFTDVEREFVPGGLDSEIITAKK
ncbi:MAG: methyltransferase domain-containing protein [Acidobacteria bacterium]|nr:methyltransferase domain-containing protein [Acidobacteriota bacterium]